MENKFPDIDFRPYERKYGFPVQYAAHLSSFRWLPGSRTLICGNDEMLRIHIHLDQSKYSTWDKVPGLVVRSHVTGKEYLFRCGSIVRIGAGPKICKWLFAPSDKECPVHLLIVDKDEDQ